MRCGFASCADRLMATTRQIDVQKKPRRAVTRRITPPPLVVKCGRIRLRQHGRNEAAGARWPASPTAYAKSDFCGMVCRMQARLSHDGHAEPVAPADLQVFCESSLFCVDRQEITG